MAKTNTSTKQNAETREFQTEAKQLLHLMTHSLYSNREIFLRELISNASDACDKLRFEALNNASLLEDSPDTRVRIDIDEKKKTISISDNGIGMSRQEVIDNIGTIASSGTAKFMAEMSGDEKKDSAESFFSSPLISAINLAVPELAIVPILSITSCRLIPMPLSEMLMVFFFSSISIRTRVSGESSNKDALFKASKRSLSHASDALDISSRKKISRLL